MKAILVSKLIDKRSKCLSMMCEITIGDYLTFIAKTYDDRGGIEGQREILKTKSAITIRNRMVDDVKDGAILPPIVIGIPLDGGRFDQLSSANAPIAPIEELVREVLNDGQISFALIDGMQRTTAVKLAADQKPEIKDSMMRLELWIATSINSLLYRMLVLNTGQIPWDVRKQLEVVFNPVAKDVIKEIPGIKIFTKEQNRRRANPLEFQGDDLIEMFIAFSSRKEKVDSKEHIAQEFTRLDLAETTNRTDIINQFVRALKLFCRMDEVFSMDESNVAAQSRNFRDGKALMNSQPLRIGFMTALAIKVFGRPGRDNTAEAQEKMFGDIENGLQKLFDNLNGLLNVNLKKFIDIDTLNGVLPKASSRIGEHDRKFFKDAFTDMFESIVKEDLPSMTSCWRAY